MLSYSEALTMLKAGEDMRCTHWPAGHFVRLATAPPHGFHGQTYLTTKPEQIAREQLQANWVKA